jgi:hypothetical protein
MNDLLGDPVAPTPAMDAPLPWRVYRLNDCDWWVARTLEEAKADFIQTVGSDWGNEFEDAEELSEADMERLQFIDTDEDERPLGTKTSFRDELARRVAAGITAPEQFASTEY